MTTTSPMSDVWRRAHDWIAAETMLFEALGSAARTSDAPPAVRRALGTWSNRHAWHADLWRDRVPVVDHHSFAPVDDGVWVDERRSALAAGVIDALGDTLDELQRRVSEHRQLVEPQLDGPTARVLDLVAADLVIERSEFAALTAEL